MSEATAKNNPGLNSHKENQFHCDETLRLLSINQARKILHIKHDDMKRLVTSGKIRYVIIEGKTKIPYFELKEFLQNNLIRDTDIEEKNSRKAEVEINNIINKYKKSYGINIRTEG
jgi:hypothetical protein